MIKFNYSGAHLQQTGFIKSWQPLMDRIEIKGEIEKESLAKILHHSRAKCNFNKFNKYELYKLRGKKNIERFGATFTLVNVII